MKRSYQKLFSLLLIAAVVFSFCAIPAAAADAPIVKIDRKEKEMDPIRPGEEFTLEVTIHNTDLRQQLINPVVKFEPSEAFLIMDSVATQTLSNIRQNETVTVSVKLRARSSITDPSQYLMVSLSYDYYSLVAEDYVRLNSDEKVFIPVVTADTPTPPPTLQPGLAVITRGDVAPVTGGSSFTLNVNITNTGAVAMTQPVLAVSPDSTLMTLDATRTRLLDDIAPGATITVPVQLQARSQISSASLGVDLTLDYTCGNEKGSAAETVYIPAVVNQTEGGGSGIRIEGATPNVILSQYSYGDEPQVAAGSEFELSMEFRNTSANFTVENIVMTISTGEGLTISSSSNTMYYPALKPGETQSEALSITALPTAKTGSAAIDLNFSYEYVDNMSRMKVSTSQSITVPIYQPDRFEIEAPAVPEYASAYDEMYISMPWVNKGKSEISNVRAELISEDGSVSSIMPVQNLGNFAPGSSGTVDFIFTPQMPGEVSFSFRISYEDPSAREKTLDFPVTMFVEEPFYPSFDDPGFDDPGFYEPVEDHSGMPWWGWALIGVAGVGAVTGAVVLIRRKRSKAAGELNDFVWEEEPADTVGTGSKK